MHDSQPHSRCFAHRRLCFLPIALLPWLASLAASPPAQAAQMDKAHLRPRSFKIYDGHLNADQKRCLAFALKQYVMYDEVPTADDGANRNETNDDVTAAGPDHNWEAADGHSRSSRSLSADERNDMRDAYGDSSPFHAPGQPVKDPTQPNSGWFTDDEGAADLAVEVVSEIQAEGVDSKTLGLADFATNKEWDPHFRRNWYFKGRWASSPAILWMKETPNDLEWCYPSDTNGDGWITNADAKCAPWSRDWYWIIKHELGHYFSFSHRGGNFIEQVGPEPPFYETPLSLCSTVMTAFNEQGACEAEGTEFGQHARRMYFASDRPGGYGGSDIWYALWNDSLAAWVGPTNCGPSVNSASNEIDPFSGFGDAILYFASDRPAGAGGYDLYLVEREGVAVWDSLQVLPAGINSSADETGPCETSDRLYFASNRAGGFGGFDLYVALLSDSSNLEWQAPSNVGAPVNTARNEIDPEVAFQNADSTAVVYFASDQGGPAASGGYDIYRTGMTLGSWASPLCVGAAVNTAFHETDPCLSLGNRALHIASDRPDGHGRWDLFTARNLAPRPAVVWDHDGSAPPGQPASVAFDLYNRGFTPIQLSPVAQNDHGWAMQFNPNPMQLGPGEGVPFTVQVSIPPDAPGGSEARVELLVQAQGMGSAIAMDHGFVRVEGAAGIYGPSSAIATNLSLEAFPNPFEGTANLLIGLARPSKWVRIGVYDVSGRLVKGIRVTNLAAGSHAVAWDGNDETDRAVPSGLYFIRVRIEQGDEQTRTLLRLRR